MVTREELLNRICLHNITYTFPNDEVHNQVIWDVCTLIQGLSQRGQSGDYYADQRNSPNGLSNGKLGKYGEFGAAAIAFEHFGFPVVEPDCRIYEKGDKSFECDLPFSHFDASLPDAGVKTCDDNTLATTARIGDTYSWLWQYKNKKNPGGLDRLFNDPESMELQFLMYTPKVWHGSITLIATAPWKLLYPLIINRTTVLEGLQSIKRCLYYNDLLAAWTGWSSPLTGQTFLRNGAASADAL